MSDLDHHALELPTLYPLAHDAASDKALLVRLDEAAYREAAFLDERILQDFGPGEWITWSEVLAALPRSGRECDFIFHIGHVGSTLLSRLLDHSPKIFGLREPALLRALAAAELAGEKTEILSNRADACLRLWARTWRPDQKTLLKATSFTSELGPRLMALQPDARAILMIVPPAVHLAGILGGPTSRQELRLNAAMRLRRLEQRSGLSGWRLDSMTDGEIAAMSWACEVASLAEIASEFRNRCLWFNFEKFLHNPGRGLARSLEHLHGEAPADVVKVMTESRDMGRYSKAMEHGYDADVRRSVLAQANRQYAREIGQGLVWLDVVARGHSLIGDVVELAGAI